MIGIIAIKDNEWGVYSIEEEKWLHFDEVSRNFIRSLDDENGFSRFAHGSEINYSLIEDDEGNEYAIIAKLDYLHDEYRQIAMSYWELVASKKELNQETVIEAFIEGMLQMSDVLSQKS